MRSARFQIPPASSGICSIKRRLRSSANAHCNKLVTSPSFIPRNKTVLILTGIKPASFAACIPANTSGRRSLYVIFLNTSRSSVSKLILIRRKPASNNGFASLASAIPLVVMDKIGGFSIAEIRETISTISGRKRGSPPVRRISSMPCETPTLIIEINSSVVRSSSDGNHAAKSCGMQYEHRRLHRSVKETRRSL